PFRNQRVASFELHVDLGEGVLEAVPGDHQPVVDVHEPEREQQYDWRKTCLMESCRWNPAEKLGISHGRSSKDGYHIYRVPPTILWSFPLRMQLRGYFPGREASLGRRTGRSAARRRAVLMREVSGRARRYGLRAFATPGLGAARRRFAHVVLLAELRRADPTRPAPVAQDVAVDAHARSGARRSRDTDATRRRSLGLGGPREASRQLRARAHK